MRSRRGSATATAAILRAIAAIARYAPTVLLDLVAVAATYLLAVTVRTGARFDIPNVGGAVALALAAGVAQVLANTAFHVYRRDWSVAGLEDLVALAKATGVVVVGLLAFNVVSPDNYLPYGAVLSGGAAVLIVEGALRLRARWPQAMRAILGRPDRRTSAIVVGAGTTGQLLARHLAGRADGYAIACFVDDDPKKQGTYVRGIGVQGTVDDLPSLIERHAASLVVIATAHPAGDLARRVVERCDGSDVRIRAVSGFGLPEGDMSPLRSIGIEELLAREPVDLDTDEARALIRGRSVLVTGAAGSIGSELCRRISRLDAKRLILLDTNENGLHEITLELGGDVPHAIVLGDIRDRSWLDRTIRELEPDILFHAAAYKHVPIIERQPLAGIATNVLGTANVIEAAVSARVEHLVFVSSDKAVAPVSVLGLTKRFGELLTIAAGREAGLPWTAVRFGNVLGSSGSVVPLFAQQLDRGGPLTLTDPDAMRYFMTISEAAGLLVEGAAIARPGDLLVLEMGAPVPIAELARKMIRLRGLRVSDVEISRIGLRPGEKLTEQLLFSDEEVEGTPHPEVLRAASRRPAPTLASLRATVAAIEERVAAADPSGAIALLRSAVGSPEPVVA